MSTEVRILMFVGWLVATGLPGGRPLLAGQTLVRGRVVGSGRPLANATVTVDARALRTSTTDSGRYRFVVQDPGVIRVFVHAVGFYPTSRRFVLAGGDTLDADFSLTPVPQLLDSITVTARPAAPPGKLQGFEHRRQQGSGRFYTREFLAQRGSSPLAEVLRLTPNLQLFSRPERCGGGFAVATGRNPDARFERWMLCGGVPMTPACYSPIFLDGALLWGPGTPGVPPPDVNQLRINDLEGIEVYRSASETPLQYRALGSACGVVLLWTRVGGT